MEVDITKPVEKLVKYSFPALVAAAVGAALLIWQFTTRPATLLLSEAEVTGPLVAVNSRVAGTIEEIAVKDGDVVAAGDVLAKLKVKVNAEEIAQLEKTAATMQHNYATLQQGITRSRPVYSDGGDSEQMAKMQRLYDMGAVSAVELERAAASAASVSYETVTEPAPPDVLESARRQMLMAEAALKQARDTANQTTVKAPVAGAVILAAQSGDEVYPGQPLAALGDIDRLTLTAVVDAATAEKLAPGNYAEYKLSGQNLTGTVLAVEPDGENGYKVHVSIPRRPDLWPRPGAKTAVTVSL